MRIVLTSLTLKGSPPAAGAPGPGLPGVRAAGGQTPDRTRHKHRTGVVCPSGTPCGIECFCLRAVYPALLLPQRSSAFQDLSRCQTSTFYVELTLGNSPFVEPCLCVMIGYQFWVGLLGLRKVSFQHLRLL